MSAHRIKPYSLRIDDQLKERARLEAEKYRHSLNVEISLLIEEALHARQQKSQKQQA